jgi:hypothetical protein
VAESDKNRLIAGDQQRRSKGVLYCGVEELENAWFIACQVDTFLPD